MIVKEYIAKQSEFTVPKFALERAVKNLNRVEAIALIRIAYRTGEQYASLDDAEDIYTHIIAVTGKETDHGNQSRW